MHAWVCAGFLVFLALGIGCEASPAEGESEALLGVEPVRCWPKDPNPGYDMACRPRTQICVHDYARVSQYPYPNSCQPLVVECLAKPTCECLLQHFRCGYSTTCSVAPEGLLRVVCQPD